MRHVQRRAALSTPGYRSFGLDLASEAGFTRHIVAERVADVLVGCSIAILGTLFAFRKRDRAVKESPPGCGG